MMTNKYIQGFLIILGMLSPFLSANAGSALTPYTTIERIYISNFGRVYVRFTDEAARINPGGCISTAYALFPADISERTEKIWLSSVQLALASGKRVRARVFDDRCEGSYASLYSLSVHQ